MSVRPSYGMPSSACLKIRGEIKPQRRVLEWRRFDSGRTHLRGTASLVSRERETPRSRVVEFDPRFHLFEQDAEGAPWPPLRPAPGSRRLRSVKIWKRRRKRKKKRDFKDPLQKTKNGTRRRKNAEVSRTKPKPRSLPVSCASNVRVKRKKKNKEQKEAARVSARKCRRNSPCQSTEPPQKGLDVNPALLHLSWKSESRESPPLVPRPSGS